MRFKQHHDAACAPEQVRIQSPENLAVDAVVEQQKQAEGERAEPTQQEQQQPRAGSSLSRTLFSHDITKAPPRLDEIVDAGLSRVWSAGC